MVVIRILVLLICCICVIGLSISRPSFVSSVDDETASYVDTEKLKQHVIYLSETVVPRDSEHPENLQIAAAYIKRELSEFSSDVTFQNYEMNNSIYTNVIAQFGPTSDEAKSGEIIIIGAHYDAYSELPGADDNASGVAGLIELGRLLSSMKFSKQVLLVAYTLEEPPYYAGEGMGSYVHALSIDAKKVKLMISLEMIGYFNDAKNSQRYPISAMKLLYPSQANFIAVVDEFTGNAARGLKSSINQYTDLPAYSINAPKSMVSIDFSDHRSYWAFGIPAVMVTDTSFYRSRTYHTKRDTADRLNYELMAKVVFGVFKYVENISIED